MDKEAPEIIDKILTFINNFDNPDDSTEEYKTKDFFNRFVENSTDQN